MRQGLFLGYRFYAPKVPVKIVYSILCIPHEKYLFNIFKVPDHVDSIEEYFERRYRFCDESSNAYGFDDIAAAVDALKELNRDNPYAETYHIVVNLELSQL